MVLSRDVVVDMVMVHNSSNYYKLDDVYIGMLALRLGVDAHHDRMFQLIETDCDCEKGTIVKHVGDKIDCMDDLYICDREHLVEFEPLPDVLPGFEDLKKVDRENEKREFEAFLKLEDS